MPMGSILKSVYDYVDPYETLEESFKSDPDTNVHDYQPDSTPVQMYALDTQLMKYELPDVPSADTYIPVSISSIKSSFNTSNVVDLKNFTLDSMLQNMPEELSGKENISLSGLDIYVYAVAPSEIGTLKSLTAKITYDSNPGGESILIPQTEYNFVSVSPAFPDGKNIYRRNLSSVPYTAKLNGERFTELLNERRTNMKLSVSAELESSVTQLQKSSFNNDDYSIYLKAVIVMPMQFRFTGPVTYKAYSAEEDLFQRKDGKFEDETKKIIDIVDSISLKLNVQNNSGLSPYIRFADSSRTVDGKPYTGTGISKEYLMSGGQVTIDFSSEEKSRITDSTLFCPEFYIYVPDSNGQVQSILRGASVKSSFNAFVKFNGKLKVF